MNIARIRKTLALAVSTLLLATACGGGDDDEAGSLTPFSVDPAEVTLAGSAADTCPAPQVLMTVTIYGGTAPYRIDNAFSRWLATDKASVGDRGGKFTVSSLGGCIENGTIGVYDKNERLVKVTVNLAKGE